MERDFVGERCEVRASHNPQRNMYMVCSVGENRGVLRSAESELEAAYTPTRCELYLTQVARAQEERTEKCNGQPENSCSGMAWLVC